MKVALLGANGQLGQDLRGTVPEGIELFPLTHKDLDVTQKDEVRRVLLSLRPEVIINTTAYVKVDQAEEEVEEAFLVNSVAVKYLVEVARKLEAVLVHFSTDYVFDGAKREQKEPYFEEDLPNPLNVYGLSKYAGELILKNYCLRYYLFRVASLYGKAGASGKGGNFVYTILNKARQKETLRVVDDIYMSPTYTRDAAQKTWEIILTNAPFGLYHLTNQGYCTWFEFAKAILDLSGLETEIIPVKHSEYPTKAFRPLWSPLASQKGFLLRPWPEALADFLKSLKIAN